MSPRRSRRSCRPWRRTIIDATTGEDELAPLPAPTLLADISLGGAEVAPANRNPNDPSTWGKVGRNENCPCGSGKKFKHCHGRFA